MHSVGMLLTLTTQALKKEEAFFLQNTLTALDALKSFKGSFGWDGPLCLALLHAHSGIYHRLNGSLSLLILLPAILVIAPFIAIREVAA